MQKIVIVANGAAYGSESLFNSLRLAIALREKESDLALQIFLMSDAVTAGITTLPLIEGVEIGTLVELAEWTLTADKVLTF